MTLTLVKDHSIEEQRASGSLILLNSHILITAKAYNELVAPAADKKAQKKAIISSVEKSYAEGWSIVGSGVCPKPVPTVGYQIPLAFLIQLEPYSLEDGTAVLVVFHEDEYVDEFPGSDEEEDF